MPVTPGIRNFTGMTLPSIRGVEDGEETHVAVIVRICGHEHGGDLHSGPFVVGRFRLGYTQGPCPCVSSWALCRRSTAAPSPSSAPW